MKTVECHPAPSEAATGFLSTLDLVVEGHDRKQANGRKQNRGEAAAPPVAASPFEVPATVVGRLVGLSAAGAPRVTFPGADDADGVPARTTAPLTSSQVGSEV